MTWLLLGLLTVGVSAYVVAPLLRTSAASDPKTESARDIAEAREQLVRLEADLAARRLNPESAQQTRLALEQRVLECLDAQKVGARVSVSGLARYIVPVFLVVSGLGLYSVLGTPDFQSRLRTAEQDQQLQALQQQSLPELAASLERQLTRDPSPPVEGYILLARSRMTLGQFDAAFAAYDKALELSGNDQSIAAEKASAEAYAGEQLPVIDEATRAAVADMSESERQAMIEGMVERLANRLADAPEDPDGWLRLIRARLVLGQDEQARADLGSAIAAMGTNLDKRATLLEGAAAMGLAAPEAPENDPD